MNRKPRIELEDKLAEQFVFRPEQTSHVQNASQLGENSSKSNAIANQKTNFMSEMSLPQKEPVMRLSLDLSISIHERLDVISKRTRRKKSEIGRMAIEKFLTQVESEFTDVD